MIGLTAWWAPVALAALLLGPSHVLVSVGTFFSKLATVSFGGAYALLAYMAQQAVEAKGWLSAAEMVDGLGLAETTPGPLILVTQFVGFLAGYRDAAPFSPVTAGVIAAAMTTWVTFSASMLWIFAGAPFVEQLRSNRMLTGALAAITAAVVGVILNLTVWFALHVLFVNVTEQRTGIFRWYAFDPMALDLEDRGACRDRGAAGVSLPSRAGGDRGDHGGAGDRGAAGVRRLSGAACGFSYPSPLAGRVDRLSGSEGDRGGVRYLFEADPTRLLASIRAVHPSPTALSCQRRSTRCETSDSTAKITTPATDSRISAANMRGMLSR